MIILNFTQSDLAASQIECEAMRNDRGKNKTLTVKYRLFYLFVEAAEGCMRILIMQPTSTKWQRSIIILLTPTYCQQRSYKYILFSPFENMHESTPRLLRTNQMRHAQTTDCITRLAIQSQMLGHWTFDVPPVTAHRAL